MWVLISRRLRTWLLLAVGLPVVRWVLNRVAAALRARKSDSRSARVLCRIDDAAARLSRRRKR